MSGCTTAFPSAALDWGHGAKALEQGSTRGQAGAGAGVVFYMVTQDGAPEVLREENYSLGALW